MAQEKAFENKVKQFLKDQGCWFVKYWGGGVFTKSGIPDLLICCNGYFIGAEIKAANGKPEDLQIYHRDKINESNGFGLILYPKDFNDFKQLIQKIRCNEIEEARKFHAERW